MPKKSTNKEKGARKRRRSSKNREMENEENTAPKRKKVTTRNKLSESIAKSKQLSEKLQRTRSVRTPSNRKMQPRIYGNSKPMPSLAELERMFDSDSDESQAAPSTREMTERPKTPEQKLNIDKEMISPNTIKKIATNLMDMIEKLPTIVLDDDGPPPVIPPKKRKKPDEPYIVGCKERPQVPWQPKTSFCKGEEDYGVKQNAELSDNESCDPKKRQNRSGKVNISKSIFNAKSDEIAARLLQSDYEKSPESGNSDSDKTVDYDYTYNSPSQPPRAFSPLPSTSRDNDTILKNDERFNMSLKSEPCLDDSLHNDVEVIENSCEIVVVDDIVPNTSSKLVQPLNDYTEDDCCIIVPSDVRKDTSSPIRIDSPKDEFYGSLNLNQNYENDVCEIIDVDDVIAENKAIIEKYRKASNLDTVTLVEPSTYTPKHSQDNSKSDINVHNVTLSASQAPNAVEVQSAQICSDVSHIDLDTNIDPSLIQIEVIRNSQNSPNCNTHETGISTNPGNENITPSGPMDFLTAFSTLEDLFYFANGVSNRRRPARNSHQFNTNSQNSQRNTHIRNIAERQNDSVNSVSNDYVHPQVQVTDITSVPANQHTPLPGGTTMLQNEPEQNRTSQSTRDCPICLDSLSSKPAASTICGHIFCMNCIKAAFKANGKKCPTCRKVLRSGVGYHPLFL